MKARGSELFKYVLIDTFGDHSSKLLISFSKEPVVEGMKLCRQILVFENNQSKSYRQNTKTNTIHRFVDRPRRHGGTRREKQHCGLVVVDNRNGGAYALTTPCAGKHDSTHANLKQWLLALEHGSRKETQICLNPRGLARQRNQGANTLKPMKNKDNAMQWE